MIFETECIDEVRQDDDGSGRVVEGVVPLAISDEVGDRFCELE